MSLIEKHFFALSVISQASDLIDSTSDISVETKTHHRDLVTIVDNKIQEFISDAISFKYESDQIIGEETWVGESEIREGNTWVVDPIDGTTNFVKQGTDFAIMLSYFENSVPTLSYVYLVDTAELYYAVKDLGVYCNHQKILKPAFSPLKNSLISIGTRENFQTRLLEKVVSQAFDIRYFGSSAIDGIRTITGQLGGFINPAGGPWDFAPFILFASELGLHISDFSGDPLYIGRYSDFILTNHIIYDELKNELSSYQFNP